MVGAAGCPRMSPRPTVANATFRKSEPTVSAATADSGTEQHVRPAAGTTKMLSQTRSSNQAADSLPQVRRATRLQWMPWVCMLLLGLPVNALAPAVGASTVRAPVEEEHHSPATPTSLSAATEQRHPPVRREPAGMRRDSGDENVLNTGRFALASDRGHCFANGLLAPLRC